MYLQYISTWSSRWQVRVQVQVPRAKYKYEYKYFRFVLEYTAQVQVPIKYYISCINWSLVSGDGESSRGLVAFPRMQLGCVVASACNVAVLSILCAVSPAQLK